MYSADLVKTAIAEKVPDGEADVVGAADAEAGVAIDVVASDLLNSF